MVKRKKLIIVTVSVLGAVLVAGLIFLVLLRSDTVNTHDVEICVEYSDEDKLSPTNCTKYRTAKIVNGSENIEHTSDKADCSQYGGEPLFEYVGGFVWYSFRGCEVK